LIGFFVLHDLDEKFILSEMKCSRRKSKRRSEKPVIIDRLFCFTRFGREVYPERNEM
jgi:hypothetical protein